MPPTVSEALELMESHIADPLDLEQIAGLVGVSPRQLQRQFADNLGQSVIQTYRLIRLETAQGLLRISRVSLGEIALMTGFATQAVFSTAYKQQFGMTPSAARKIALGAAE